MQLGKSNRRWRSGILMVMVASLAIACGPEAQRVRGGGMGADPGNYPDRPFVTIHDEIDIYYDTPTMGRAVERQGRTEPARDRPPEAGLGVAQTRTRGGAIYPFIPPNYRPGLTAGGQS
jgi:hypothetical protein